MEIPLSNLYRVDHIYLFFFFLFVFFSPLCGLFQRFTFQIVKRYFLKAKTEKNKIKIKVVVMDLTLG